MTHWIHSERTLYGDVSERIFSSSRKDQVDSFKIKKLILRGPEDKSEVTRIELKVFPLNRYDPVNKWVAAFKQETNMIKIILVAKSISKLKKRLSLLLLQTSLNLMIELVLK